jgi:ribonucleoside-diphosphate reductase subunit M1
MYYLRSRAAADAIKFTVDTSVLQVMTRDNHYFFYHFFFVYFTERNSHLWAIQDKKLKSDGAAAAADDDDTKMAQMVCSLANRDDCLACGS